MVQIRLNDKIVVRT